MAGIASLYPQRPQRLQRGAARLGFLATAVFAGLCTGCDASDADIGKPCERKSDCAGALICDIHEGQGSCQTEHTHDTDGEDAGVASVRWIDVAASNYKLELVPDFDPEVEDYVAQADGPGIEVYIDVLLDGDVDAVHVNGEAATEEGYRSWRSPEAAELVAPTDATIEVIEDGEVTAVIDIEITVP